jgi:peptidoglycan/LPS O-acetylase OafA/YrhL
MGVPSLDEPQGPGYERHIPELDGIRGMAALTVVFYHIAQKVIRDESGWFQRFLDACLLGFLGVDIFFALSGFLITRILLRNRRASGFYRNFYARRLLRLVPAYLLTIVVVAACVPRARGYLLLSLFYVANFSALFHVPMRYGVLWSLSVEEQFYMIWPSMVRFLTPRHLFWLSLLVCALTPVGRAYAVLDGGLNVYLSWFRLDGLAWGALLAIMLSEGECKPGPVMRRVTPILGALLFIVGVFFYATARKEMAGALFYSAVPMLTVTLIAYAAGQRRRVLAPLRSRTLRFFGDISYWLYLIHFFFLNQADAFLKERYPSFMAHSGLKTLWLAMTVAVLAPSIVSGIVVRRWLELPILRMKARFV